MAKRKRKSRSKQSAASLRSRGLHAFNRNDYSGAIDTWRRANQRAPNAVSAEALAEAHFRLALGVLYGADARATAPPALERGLQALREALRLVPGDPCYTYHLGLAEHHAGHLDRAVQAYQAVRASTEDSARAFAQRAAFPLALSLMREGQDPTQGPVWADLAPSERTMLLQAQALESRPTRPPPDMPSLWRGIAALERGALEEAETALVRAAEDPEWPEHQATAHYYLGVLAALREEWDEAGRQWTAAHAGGFSTEWVKDNIGELYHRRAEEWLEREDEKLALSAATEAMRHKADDGRLADLVSQIHQRLGYQAASAGQWKAALKEWDKAREVGGGSFRLAYNLALAYEQDEEWLHAGETWREALRRRPRRDDHPDAVTDEQVARLWRRAAEAYAREGEPEESVRVYRQALKWNPDDLETRMLLVQELLDDGRLVAAENELGRVLEREPDHIPALLLLGEVVAESGYWWQESSAPSYWKRVLELEPGHVEARELLVDFLVEQAQQSVSWGNYPGALDRYGEALTYQPQNPRVLTALARCHLQMGLADEAEEYINQAMAHAADDLMVFGDLIGIWVEEGEIERAKQVMAQAEAAVDAIPFTFYIVQGGMCVQAGWEDLAHTWLDRAIEQADEDDQVYVAIGEMAVMLGAFEIGDEYLERAIHTGRDVGMAYLLRGLLSFRGGDSDAAHAYWDRAEKVARREHDQVLAAKVEAARMVFSLPPYLRELALANPSLFDEGGLPGGFPFPSIDAFWDEDEDDDDEFFF